MGDLWNVPCKRKLPLGKRKLEIIVFSVIWNRWRNYDLLSAVIHSSGGRKCADLLQKMKPPQILSSSQGLFDLSLRFLH